MSSDKDFNMDDATVDMIQEILSSDSGMTGWEMDFIEKVKHLKKFTQSQCEKVAQIWDKVCG
jgi:hypothetical protein